MDLLHIEGRYTKTFLLPEDFIAKLPRKVAIFTTIQFQNSLKPVKEQLKAAGILVETFRPRRTRHEGQILGCSTTKFETDADFLYVGDGLFHPKALLLRNPNKKVYSYNPKSGEEDILTPESTITIRKKIIGMYSKFLTSKNIGVLLSLKNGQNKAYLAKNLEEQYPDKTFYYFADNTYNFTSLQDFPFIDMYLNTMCERIGYDDMDVQGMIVMNLEDLWDIKEGIFD